MFRIGQLFITIYWMYMNQNVLKLYFCLYVNNWSIMCLECERLMRWRGVVLSYFAFTAMFILMTPRKIDTKVERTESWSWRMFSWAVAEGWLWGPKWQHKRRVSGLRDPYAWLPLTGNIHMYFILSWSANNSNKLFIFAVIVAECISLLTGKLTWCYFFFWTLM